MAFKAALVRRADFGWYTLKMVGDELALSKWFNAGIVGALDVIVALDDNAAKASTIAAGFNPVANQVVVAVFVGAAWTARVPASAANIA